MSYLDKFRLGNEYYIRDFMGAQVKITKTLDNYGSNSKFEFDITFPINDSRYICSLDVMYGNESLLISHDSYKATVAGGYGTLANKIRCEIMRLEGYKGIICTVNSTNVKQLKIMQNNDWIKSGEYTQTIYGTKQPNKIYLFFKELLNEKETASRKEYKELFL